MNDTYLQVMNNTTEERREHDFYPTPPATVESLLRATVVKDFPKTFSGTVLDLGAGEGVWGEAMRHFFPEARIHGVELRPVKANMAYDLWVKADLMDYLVNSRKYDIILGNPPFRIQKDGKNIPIERAIPLACQRLNNAGGMYLLLKQRWVASVSRYHHLFNGEYCPANIFCCTSRISFYKSERGSVSNTEDYFFFHWHRYNNLARGNFTPPGNTRFSWIKNATRGGFSWDSSNA